MHGEYQIAVIDPPWPYRDTGAKQVRTREGYDRDAWPYPVLTTSDVFDIIQTKIMPNMAPKHTVFIWAIERSLQGCEAGMESLGYKRHVRMIWDKRTGLAPAFTVRYTHEYLVWYHKGGITYVAPGLQGKVGSVFSGGTRQHSRKPDAAYDMIQAWFPSLSKVDVFSRENRQGWDSWGNETGKFDDAGSILTEM